MVCGNLVGLCALCGGACGAQMTREDFKHWWLVQHRGLAMQLPKIRKYAVNIVNAAEDEDTM